MTGVDALRVPPPIITSRLLLHAFSRLQQSMMRRLLSPDDEALPSRMLTPFFYASFRSADFRNLQRSLHDFRIYADGRLFSPHNFAGARQLATMPRMFLLHYWLHALILYWLPSMASTFIITTSIFYVIADATEKSAGLTPFISAHASRKKHAANKKAITTPGLYRPTYLRQYCY